MSAMRTTFVVAMLAACVCMVAAVPLHGQMRAEAFLPESTFIAFSIEDAQAARRAIASSRLYGFVHAPENAPGLNVRAWDAETIDTLARETLGVDFETLLGALQGQVCLALTDITNINFGAGEIHSKSAAIARVGADTTLATLLTAVVERDLRRRAQLPPGVEDPAPLFSRFRMRSEVFVEPDVLVPNDEPDGFVLDEALEFPRVDAERAYAELKESAFETVDVDGIAIVKYQYAPRRYLSWATVDGWLVAAGPFRTTVEQHIRIYRQAEALGLAGNPGYAAALRQHTADGGLAFGFINVESMLNRFRVLLPPAALQALDRLGLSNIAYLAAGESAREDGFRLTASLTTTDGQLRGLLKAAAGVPIDMAWIDVVPRDAATVSVTGVDEPAMWRLISEEAIMQFGPLVRMFVPQLPEALTGAWAIANDRLLPAIAAGGVEFTSILSAAGAPDEMNNVALTRLSNAEAFQEALDAILARLKGFDAVGGRGMLEPLEAMGDVIRFIGSPEPARIALRRGYVWDVSKLDGDMQGRYAAVVFDNWFAHSSSVDLLESVVRREGPSIRTHEGFTRAIESIGPNESLRALTYSDLAAFYGYLYRRAQRGPDENGGDTPFWLKHFERRQLRMGDDGEDEFEFEIEPMRVGPDAAFEFFEALGIGLDIETLPTPEAMARALRPVLAAMRADGGSLTVQVDVPAGPSFVVSLLAEQLLIRAAEAHVEGGDEALAPQDAP